MQSLRTSMVVLGLACAGTFFAAGQDRYDHDYDNRAGDRYRDQAPDSDRYYQLPRENRDREYEYYSNDRRNNYRDSKWEPRTIEISKLPKPVQTAIRRRSGEAAVVRVDQESHRGQVQYRVQTRQNGQRGFFRVTSDGTFIGATSEEMDWAEGGYFNQRERLRPRDYPDYEQRDYGRNRAYDRSRDDAFDRSYDRERHYDRYGDRRAPRGEAYRGSPEGAYYDGYGRGRPADPDSDRYMRHDDRDRYGARNNREMDDRELERRYWEDRDLDRRAWEDGRSIRPGDADRQWSRSRDYDRDWDRSEGVSRYRDDRANQDTYPDSRKPGGRVQEWEEQNLKLSTLPQEVQTTIRKHTGTGKITRIDRETNRGQVRYKVQVNQDGKDTFFQVALTGEFIGATAQDENKATPESKTDRPNEGEKPDEKK